VSTTVGICRILGLVFGILALVTLGEAPWLDLPGDG
jgi:hypothetical protein